MSRAHLAAALAEATAAVVATLDGRIYVRSDSRLWRFGRAEGPAAAAAG